MTREEARKRMTEFAIYNDIDNSRYSDFTVEAFKMAIKALKEPEQKHGKWIERPFLLGTSQFCSLCGNNYGMPHGIYKFCPSCGAKMDEEAGE